MGASSARSPSALSVTAALFPVVHASVPAIPASTGRSLSSLPLGRCFDSPGNILERFLRRYRFRSDSTHSRDRKIGVATVHDMATVRAPDVQAAAPPVHLSLSSVGVTAVEKIIHIGERLYAARLGCVVALGPRQKGAHMSRFEETVNQTINEVVHGEGAFRAEDVARRAAELVRERQ